MTAGDDEGSLAPPEHSRGAGEGDEAPAPGPDAAPLRYVRGGELGRGGMGLVVAAFDPVLERTVALKRPLQPTPAGAARLLREARLAARLDHPAIAAVLDFGRDEEGRVCAVLPVRQGRSLAQAVSQAPEGTPSPGLLRALLVASQAVAHAHARGVVHRDLSPANVQLGEDGAVWVFDWGLAATLEDAAREGFSGGTQGYMAPEQRQGRPGSRASDVWSLGALLHLVCARTAPPATLPKRAPRGCPAALWAVCRQALSPEPAARYADAGAFAAELSAWLDGAPVQAWPEGPLARLARVARRRPRMAGLVTLAVALLLVTGTVAAVLVARAEQHARQASASLLLDSAERALHLDDVRLARQLATEALGAVESPRGRGVLAALARVAEVERAPLPPFDCEVLDVLGPVRLCAVQGQLERHGEVTRLLGTAEAGVLLASGLTVTASRGDPRVRVFDAAGALLEESALGGGLAQVRTDAAREVAVVAVADGLVHFSGKLRAVTPCTPGQGLRFALPVARRTEVLCADDELVTLDDEARVVSRRRVVGLGTLLRGAVTGDFVDADRLVVGSADGHVGVISTARAEVTRVTATGLGFLHTVVAARDGRAVVLWGERGLGVWRVGEGHLLPLELPAVTQVVPDGQAGFLAWGAHGAWRLAVAERLSLSTDLHGRSALAVHDASRRVAVGDALGHVELFDLDRGLQALVEGPVRVIKSLAFSPSGRWLALGAAGVDGVLVFDTSVTPPSRVAGDWEGHPELRARQVVFLGEDTLLAFGWGPGGWAARFSPARQRFEELPAPGAREAMRAVIGNATQLRALETSGEWRALELGLDGGVQERPLARWAPVPSVVATSPDLGHVVTAQGATVQRGASSFTVGASVEALALARDGRLAVCRRDGVVELRLADDTLQLEVAAHEARCAAVQFCDDERAVCSIGWDGRLRVIDATAVRIDLRDGNSMRLSQ